MAKGLIMADISSEEFQRRIRENFPDFWDSEGNFRYEDLVLFSRDGIYCHWVSNPEYIPLKKYKWEELRDRTAKVDIPKFEEKF